MPLAENSDVSANPVADPLSLSLFGKAPTSSEGAIAFEVPKLAHAARGGPASFPVAALSYVPGCAADLRPEVGLGGPNGGLP